MTCIILNVKKDLCDWFALKCVTIKSMFLCKSTQECAAIYETALLDSI